MCLGKLLNVNGGKTKMGEEVCSSCGEGRQMIFLWVKFLMKNRKRNRKVETFLCRSVGSCVHSLNLFVINRNHGNAFKVKQQHEKDKFQIIKVLSQYRVAAHSCTFVSCHLSISISLPPFLSLSVSSDEWLWLQRLHAGNAVSFHKKELFLFQISHAA